MLARKDKTRTFVSIDNDDELYEDKYTADWSNIPNQNIENTELRKILDESIDKLSPEYRIVFLLRDVEGLSTEETAQLTELSVPAVKSRLHRARAFLRKELNEAFSR
jgi:RNA polymerase sigma-70 factor (ECF subfamily)